MSKPKFQTELKAIQAKHKLILEFIKKFKDENNCEISVINDILWKNKEYDFIDAYYRVEDNFTQYYAGFTIGRFGNENTPDLYCNPDGLKNKTSLDIIEDILYHYTKNI